MVEATTSESETRHRKGVTAKSQPGGTCAPEEPKRGQVQKEEAREGEIVRTTAISTDWPRPFFQAMLL